MDAMTFYNPQMGLPNDVNAKNGSIGLARRLENAVKRISSALSSSQAGVLIQVWMPEVCSDGRILLSAEGLPFSISGVGDLLALFRCVSCKYKFDVDPKCGESIGAIGRVYHYGQPEMCLDVQHYDKATYVRIKEAHLCRIHSTLILPVFEIDSKKVSAVIELSHHDKSAEFVHIIDLVKRYLKEAGLSTADTRVDNWKLGLRKWPIDVCSVPSSSIHETDLIRGHPDERGISSQNSLGRALQTGFGQVSEYLMKSGLDALTGDNETVTRFFNNDSLCQNDGSRQSIETSRSLSDTGSATTQMQYTDSASPGEVVDVCPAQVPMAKEADKDIHSSSSRENLVGEGDGQVEAKKKLNRSGGGAGKRLSYGDLEAHFCHGLKEAARRLGICPTTLKRACRRNGINRWPSRQISKLLKVWKQMGYNGDPPSWLLQNAISGNLRSENLAYVLSAGLHVGLNPRRCDCSSHKMNQMYCNNCHFTDADMQIDEDIGMKNYTHHGAYTAALHGADDEAFGVQEDRSIHGNHTWHAGQMTGILLRPQRFACPPAASQSIISSRGRDNKAIDLEKTQRGGNGLIPIISDYVSTVDNTEDVLMPTYHIPLGYEQSPGLFH